MLLYPRVFSLWPQVTKRTGCRCQQRGRGRACTPTLRFEWNVHSQFRSFGRLQQYRCRSECISRNQFATFCIACLKYLQVGTIFGIHRRLSPASSVANLTDALQPARALVASGYCMYGASSILMLAVSGAVNGFTLDMSIGEFVLTHRDVKVPQRGAYYSANEGRSESWDDATKAYSSPFMLVHRYCVSAYPTKSQVRERRKEWHFLWQSVDASVHRHHGWRCASHVVIRRHILLSERQKRWQGQASTSLRVRSYGSHHGDGGRGCFYRHRRCVGPAALLHPWTNCHLDRKQT